MSISSLLFALAQKVAEKVKAISNVPHELPARAQLDSVILSSISLNPGSTCLHILAVANNNTKNKVNLFIRAYLFRSKIKNSLRIK